MSETLLCPQESNFIRWNGVASLLKAGEGLVGLPDIEDWRFFLSQTDPRGDLVAFRQAVNLTGGVSSAFDICHQATRLVEKRVIKGNIQPEVAELVIRRMHQVTSWAIEQRTPHR